MKTFSEWLNENTKRSGIAHWAYPDGYIRSHYPDGHFMPSAADALQKMAVGKHKVHHMTPPDTALGGKKETEVDYETD
jgi:hypothetical protein